MKLGVSDNPALPLERFLVQAHNGDNSTTTSVKPRSAMSNKDPLRFHQGHRNKGAFGEGFVARTAEKIADAMGTVQFVLASTVVIIAWVVVNGVVKFLTDSYQGLLKGQGFDPAPFILLNLMFSAVAYYSASMVMIAQKTQARRDQAREEADAKHREELAAALPHMSNSSLMCSCCPSSRSTTSGSLAVAMGAPPGAWDR